MFIGGIGAPLASGVPHDGRAPDYDDWSLNGDLLFWHAPLECPWSLAAWAFRWTPPRWTGSSPSPATTSGGPLPFHKMLLAGRLPHHRRRHRPGPPVHAAALQNPWGEVQVSLWGNHPPGLCGRRGAAAVKSGSIFPCASEAETVQQNALGDSSWLLSLLETNTGSS